MICKGGGNWRGKLREVQEKKKMRVFGIKEKERIYVLIVCMIL